MSRPQFQKHSCPASWPEEDLWTSTILHYTCAQQRDIRHPDTLGDSGALYRDLNYPSRGPIARPEEVLIKSISLRHKSNFQHLNHTLIRPCNEQSCFQTCRVNVFPWVLHICEFASCTCLFVEHRLLILLWECELWAHACDLNEFFCEGWATTSSITP